MSFRILTSVLVFSFIFSDVSLASSPKPGGLLAVLPLRVHAEYEQATDGLNQILITAIARREIYQVVSTDEINQLLELEKQKDFLSCDDTTCLADIGAMLGAQLVVSGGLSKVGDRAIFTLLLMNMRMEGFRRKC